MNIMKRICSLIPLVAFLAVVAGPAPSGDRVSEICLIGGEIERCVPREL